MVFCLPTDFIVQSRISHFYRRLSRGENAESHKFPRRRAHPAGSILGIIYSRSSLNALNLPFSLEQPGTPIKIARHVTQHAASVVYVQPQRAAMVPCWTALCFLPSLLWEWAICDVTNGIDTSARLVTAPPSGSPLVFVTSQPCVRHRKIPVRGKLKAF